MRNPVKELKEEQNWSIQEFAAAAGVSFSTARQNIEGSVKNLNDDVIELFKLLEYDPDEIQKKYKKFRKAKQQELINQAG